MRVNGNALLARKAIVSRRFGEAAWNQLFTNIAAARPFFRAPLTGASQVPIEDFLLFHDELVRRLYDGDVARYFEIGEQSARWALDEGPYRRFIRTRELAPFATSFPRLWRTYFAESSSSCVTSLVGDAMELVVSGLPNRHPYFEYLVAGYVKGALGLLCANPIQAIKLRGGPANGYRYRFEARQARVLTEGDIPRHRRSSPTSDRTPGDLSEREMGVLQLLAVGKTNKEIGAALAISDRTVQVHASNIYKKIGAPNRTAATLWLAENRHRPKLV